MNSNDIDTILLTDDFSKYFYVGTMPRDHFLAILDNFIGKSGMVIFNTHISTENGEHWIAFVKDGNNIEFIDTFGRSLNNFPDIKNKILSLFPQCILKFNSSLFQGFTTTVCGDYCILYCLLRSRSWTFTQIMDVLKSFPNGEIRDHTIRKVMLDRYKYISLHNKHYKKSFSGIDSVHIKTNSLGNLFSNFISLL